VEDVRRLAGRPRALQISTAYHDVTRPDETLDPAFRARERRDFQAVYQALPLCIVAALQGYAEAYATIIAYGTPTSGYWRKSALVATTACSLSQVSGKQARAVSGASSRQM
jgi:hypothetical protein